MPDDHDPFAPTADATDPLVPPPIRKALPRTFLRLAVIVIAALAMNAGMAALLTQIGATNSISGNSMMTGLLVLALIGYALLIAIPFMPGIEVGIALLLLQGAAIAPFVYVATLAGLFLAFLIGQRVPLKILHNAFRDLHMRRACEMIAKIERTPKSDRLAGLQDRLPKWLGLITVNYRYVMIGALINIPGTFAIGGGGGILMLAGVLRLFHWSGILLTLALATLPIPLTVYLWGADFLNAAPHG
jgi:hypothetical protein